MCNDLACASCSWVAYFGQWLNETYKATVRTYNLARGGRTSAVMSEEATQFLAQVGIHYLSDKDIVMLGDMILRVLYPLYFLTCHSPTDHGSNDDAASNTPERLKFMYEGVEKLIRTVLKLSRPGSFPTVILLGTHYALDFTYVSVLIAFHLHKQHRLHRREI